MQSKHTFLWVLVITSSGCASTGGQHATSPPAPVASGTAIPSAAPPSLSPLTIPAASAKRLVLIMTGPTTVTQSKSWPAFQEEWRATFADHAKAVGVAFVVEKDEPRPTGENGTLLRIVVNDYRLVGIGSRVFFGVMTGNAFINAKATYTDLNDGKPFGERDYNTSSSAWAGVFAKMTPQQVDAIATKVFGELAAANK